jgi:sporulation protein YlmC with PRC-barrel domain
MKRFLSTTAVILTMTGAAYADGHTMGFGDVAVQESDFFASDLIGMRIYNSEIEIDANAMVADGAELEWDDIGEINDVIISKDGNVTAVILGVGGFLGMGERDVSVSMDTIKVVKEEGESNDRFLVVTTSKEILEQAPEFDRGMDDEMEAEATDAATTTTDMASETALDRPMLTRPMNEREGYADADMNEVQALTAEDLEGTYVYGANDETVGEIDDLILGDDGKISNVVINVGGFLGLGEKPVAVTFDELQFLKNVNGDDVRIYIDSTEEALEAQPEYQG